MSCSFVRGMCSNCIVTTVLCCFKAKKQTEISALDFQILQLKKKFGVDYLTLVDDNASVEKLKKCLQTALNDVAELQGQIDDHLAQIDGKEQRANNKITTPKVSDETLERPATTTNIPSKSKKSPPNIGEEDDDISSDDNDDNDDVEQSRSSKARKKSCKPSSPKKKNKIKIQKNFTIDE